MKFAANLKNLVPYIVVIILSLAFLIMYLSYMRILHPEVIYMDSLRFLSYFDLSEQGKRSLILSWNQNEHRGLAPQILIYLNAKYFGLDVYRSALLSGPIIAISGVIICFEYFRDRCLIDKIDWIASIFFSVFCFFLLFSLANWEIYSLDLGVTLFGKNLAFVGYWVLLAHALKRGSLSGWRLVVLLAVGPAIILLIGYGWSYSFVAASILCILIYSRGRLKGFHLLLILSLVLGIAIYVVGGYIIPSTRIASSSSTLVSSAMTPSWSVAFISIFHAIFSAFVGVETSQILGIPGSFIVFSSFVFLCVVIWIVWVSILRRNDIPFLPAAFILYSGFHILSLAYARGRYDPTMSAAPRYYLDISLLVLGIVWAIIVSLRNEKPRGFSRHVKLVMAFLIPLAFIIGQSFTSYDEWKKAPYRHDAFLHMKALTLFGLMSKSDASLFQGRLAVVEQGIAIQRKYGIGPYRHVTCSTPAYGKGWFDADNGPSHWLGKDGEALVRNCGDNLVVRVYLPENWPGREVSIALLGNSYTKRIVAGNETVFNIPTKSLDKYIDLHISVDQATVPADLNRGSNDKRQLGVYVVSVVSE